jgi:hypothetical protein
MSNCLRQDTPATAHPPAGPSGPPEGSFVSPADRIRQLGPLSNLALPPNPSAQDHSEVPSVSFGRSHRQVVATVRRTGRDSARRPASSVHNRPIAVPFRATVDLSNAKSGRPGVCMQQTQWACGLQSRLCLSRGRRSAFELGSVTSSLRQGSCRPGLRCQSSVQADHPPLVAESGQ